MESFRIDQPVEILIVDDEPQAVKYFKKAFGAKYDVLTATSADEAETLILSGNHNIGLVISDQRMPGRSGVSLLNRIRNERAGGGGAPPKATTRAHRPQKASGKTHTPKIDNKLIKKARRKTKDRL